MTTIPPIIARGVMIDVAGLKNVAALPAAYEITVSDLQAALKRQNVDVTPGTVVLIRTGTAQFWGANGSDHAKLAMHDTAGIGISAAKWLVEQKGALAVGSDTSGLEYVPPSPADSKAVGGSFNPVHVYLLVEQGVHMLEFHNLEALAADRVYEFAYIATTNAIRGTVAGNGAETAGADGETWTSWKSEARSQKLLSAGRVDMRPVASDFWLLTSNLIPDIAAPAP